MSQVQKRSTTSAGNLFEDVLNARLSRRALLSGGAGAAAAALFGSLGVTGCSNSRPTAPALGFHAVPKGKADTVVVPPGYTATPIYRLGDPITTAAQAYANDGTDADMQMRAGDHHDGMHFFGVSAANAFDPAISDRGLLVMNHENVTQAYLHAGGPTSVDGARTVATEVDKEMAAHGVSVIELARGAGGFEVVRDSAFNRRITAMTEMELRGPVAGADLVKTKFSADGTRARGTVNNCAHGYTPWGTYLTCEENWNGYFRRDMGDEASRSVPENASLARYGIAAGAAGNFGWSTVSGDIYQRWDCTTTASAATDDYRNEPNTFGWVVEIDPFDPASVPRKRTALGRFAHEGCLVGPLRAGAPVVFYMGDDSRGDYIYKFVSDRAYVESDRGLDAGDSYLDAGTLHVARFDENGRGEWLELSFGANGLNADNPLYPFRSQADVLVNARLAADAVGATKMDRPEWAAVHPHSGEVYFTLTNNRNRGSSNTVDAANPRAYAYDEWHGTASASGNNKGNVNGHIIRWREAGDTPAATTFVWDIYIFGAEAEADAAINVSALTPDNDFSSPDGVMFDDRGILWIETDDANYTAVTNCMLLAARPGELGDGSPRIVNGQITYVGRSAHSENLRRFLVGPVECEITGLAMTPDRRTLFVNIQHPGEEGSADAPTSHWPDGGDSRPRSATIAITRDDGGEIGV